MQVPLFSSGGKPMFHQDGSPWMMSEWRLPPAHLKFVDKNDRQLCRQIADTKVLENLLFHYRHDPRILLGMIGRKGMDLDMGMETLAEPPLQGAPTTLEVQTQFLTDWFKKGYARPGRAGRRGAG